MAQNEARHEKDLLRLPSMSSPLPSILAKQAWLHFLKGMNGPWNVLAIVNLENVAKAELAIHRWELQMEICHLLREIDLRCFPFINYTIVKYIHIISIRPDDWNGLPKMLK